MHPLWAVATTEYNPGKLVCGSSSVELKLFGPDHKNVTSVVMVLASRVTELVAQVKESDCTEISGTVGSWVTRVVAEAVHPLTGLLTTRI